MDASGDVAVGTANNPSFPDIYVYHQGGDTPLNTYNLATSGANLMPRGLAWSADASRLFAVLNNRNSTYSMRIIDSPTLIASSLSLTGPGTVDLAKKVTLTGKLAVSAGAPLPAGTPVSIARSVAGGTTVKDFTVSTAANGSFTLTDTPAGIGEVHLHRQLQRDRDYRSGDRRENRDRHQDTRVADVDDRCEDVHL